MAADRLCVIHSLAVPSSGRLLARTLIDLRRITTVARPVVATPRVVAMTTGGLFTVGGVVVGVATLLDPAGFGSEAVIRLLATVAVALGAACTLVGSRLPTWTTHVFLGAGTCLVSTAVALAGSPAVATALACLIVLVAVDSAFFFAWPAAVLHLAAAVAACTLALVGPGQPGAAVALVVGGVSVLTAAVVVWLVRAAGAAEIDPLTGTVNRRGLDRLLDAALSDAAQSARPLSVAVIDLDDFKQVNDRAGHRTGDRLLVQLSTSWQSTLPRGATLARLGGDEFVVLLPGHPLPTALVVLQRLRAATPAPHTVSVGVAQWDPESPSSVLADADHALYEAKRAGRNRVVHHESAAAVRGEVRRALAEGQLIIHYQPVVDLSDGATVGAEALLRWRHPQRGLLSPAEFLPVLEGSDVLAEIDFFVLAEACRQVQTWRGRGGPATVAVNVSGEELVDPAYADRVAALLEQIGLPPSALVLEVTESSLAGESDAALTTLRRLRALGVAIAVDDFGTGYSSLARLIRLPVDILKIDRSFVQQIRRADDAAPVVQAVVALANALGLDVIAEGVEHAHQAVVLRRLGCAHAQGYLYGRPTDPHALDPRHIGAIRDQPGRGGPGRLSPAADRRPIRAPTTSGGLTLLAPAHDRHERSVCSLLSSESPFSPDQARDHPGPCLSRPGVGERAPPPGRLRSDADAEEAEPGQRWGDGRRDPATRRTARRLCRPAPDSPPSALRMPPGVAPNCHAPR
ncbi:EAL domain-containing protein [Blastococcus sp. TF02A_35]|uniref:EAL domain-containing protein n=1 Tax=Blastococcus sp. TF02A-35 TaxID=2559612 RepID=UPI0010737240|nr:EAL domain-containing protein [Blastococcus sp. TF02A_35]TFV51556.1 EAL domain-containing protein [Blastococcus sp. TF02A_35]